MNQEVHSWINNWYNKNNEIVDLKVKTKEPENGKCLNDWNCSLPFFSASLNWLAFISAAENFYQIHLLDLK